MPLQNHVVFPLFMYSILIGEDVESKLLMNVNFNKSSVSVKAARLLKPQGNNTAKYRIYGEQKFTVLLH